MNHKSGHTSKSLLNFISLPNVKRWMGGFYTVKASGIGSAKKNKKNKSKVEAYTWTIYLWLLFASKKT